VKNTENNSIQKFMRDQIELQISAFYFSRKIIRNLNEGAQDSSSFVAVAAEFCKCVMEYRKRTSPFIFKCLQMAEVMLKKTSMMVSMNTHS
jgi:hypothetical protein